VRQAAWSDLYLSFTESHHRHNNEGASLLGVLGAGSLLCHDSSSVQSTLHDTPYFPVVRQTHSDRG
jgi:hypothetical protein